MRKKLEKEIKKSSFKKLTADGYFDGDKYVGGKRERLEGILQQVRKDALIKLRNDKSIVGESGISLDKAILNKRTNVQDWKNKKVNSDIKEILKKTK